MLVLQPVHVHNTNYDWRNLPSTPLFLPFFIFEQIVNLKKTDRQTDRQLIREEKTGKELRTSTYRPSRDRGMPISQARAPCLPAMNDLAPSSKLTLKRLNGEYTQCLHGIDVLGV